MTTTDQTGTTVFDFHRCAMLPLCDRPNGDRVVHADDLSAIGAQDDETSGVPPGLDLAEFRKCVSGTPFDSDLAGSAYSSSGDVTSAPELTRLPLNIAATHHDERVGAAGRLVYGGHTIGLTLAQASRALPNLVTVLGRRSCDHTGPVHEGDTLTSDIEVLAADPIPGGGGVLELRSIMHAHRGSDPPAPVLDWRFNALMASANQGGTGRTRGRAMSHRV